MQRKEPLANKGVWHGCLTRKKHFDTSGKSAAQLHHCAICKTAHGAAQQVAIAERKRIQALCLQVLPTTESQHARCLLLFDDRTFVGDVRSSEMCQNRKCFA